MSDLPPTPPELWRDRQRLERQLREAANPIRPASARKKYARRAASLAEKLGLIIRHDKCQMCGDPDARLQRHHPNHLDGPLDVTWLCPACHHQVDHPRKRRNPNSPPGPDHAD